MSITKISTNFDALFAQNSIKSLELAITKASNRLSSGQRIVSADDDPVGISPLVKAQAQFRGYQTGQKNIQNALEMLRFRDSAMGTIQDKLLAMRDIAMQAANSVMYSGATPTPSALVLEFTAIKGTIGVTAASANFQWNSIGVLTNMDAAKYIQLGPNSGDKITLAATDLGDCYVGAAGMTVAGAITTAASAQTALGQIDTSLTTLATARSKTGQMMQQLEADLSAKLNMESAAASTVSTLGDADMAQEITNLASSQIKAQAATAILGQANIAAKMLVGLLGG